MLNIMFWTLLSAITFITLATIWQREDLYFAKMNESFYKNNKREEDRIASPTISTPRVKLNKKDSRTKAMRFYDLEQRNHGNILKYTEIKNNKRKGVDLYPIVDSKKVQNVDGSVA